MTWSITEDIFPWIGFTTAMITVLMMPVRPGGAVSKGAKWFLAASIACYMVGTSASILNHYSPLHADALTIVSMVELLWVPFILFGVYSLYARQQLNDARAAQHTVDQTSDMMSNIVDTTPAGIMVLDATGRITFANDAARRLLELTEDPDIGTLRTPGWTVHLGDLSGATAEPRPDFGRLISREPTEDAMVVLEWPQGRRRLLSVNTKPILGGDDQVTGAIVAFVDREPWKAMAR